MTSRALGADIWDRKLATLPDKGTLLVCTDLHGNWGDYQAIKRVYEAEEEAGNDPILALTGDLVHGPCPELHAPGAWPRYLGTPYRDRSAELILDFEKFSQSARTFSLLGNHEHAHIGGAVVPKFYPDEASELDRALGHEAPRMHTFLRSFPLLAVSPSGVVLTHGAPGGTEADRQAFEALDYEGFQRFPPSLMANQGTVGALLWSRMATVAQADALLRATAAGDTPNSFVAFGHDVVPRGFDRFSHNQICVSTSFALDDDKKVYLRLDLSRRYESTDDLQVGRELVRLHPDR